ncbi:MAG: protein kinase [Bacteroidales bacterium]|nr:protein kinase [Bacteroidales bacterium]
MDDLMNLLNSVKKPQETASAPQETATAPLGTVTAPQGTLTAPMEGGDAYSGGQAELVVKNSKILKIYKHDHGYNASVLTLVKQLRGKGFVVDLFDYGTMDHEGEQRQFELMEYCREGAVSGVDLRGNQDVILKIVRKVAEALDACHRAGFIHKDVKPANILIRDKATWDCVLCDFGIADVLDHGQVVTLQSRTPTYAAPEVYERTVTIGNKTYCTLGPAADFYSLGMTILCLWLGETAFRSKEQVLAIQKVHDGIVVPTDMPDPLYTLARGLLVKDPAHRWGWKEVNDFLNGVKVDVYNEHQQGGLHIIYNSSRQQVAHNVEELAAFMAGDLGLAIKYLYSGKVSKWLEHIPELQIEIENIVEKEFPRDQQMGVVAAIHTLNPFCDLRLCADLHDPDYAMTGESIGRALNEAYHHYYTKGDADVLDTLMVESFFGGSASDYLPWFFAHKGNRFVQQQRWFDYCVHGDAQNRKKAGPKDKSYLHQVAMMKAIAGFGAQPEYRLSRTGEVLRSLDDVYRVSRKELRYDLENDKGLRGWLAVLCHENPHADLKKKYSYEKLLEQYVKVIGTIDADDPAYSRFKEAQNEAKGLVSGAKNEIRSTWTASLFQKLIAIFLGFVPCALLLTDIILNIIDNPSIDMHGSWGSFVFYGLGIVAAAIAFFSMDSDGCLVPIIIGAVVSFLVTLAIALIGYIILYLYGVIVLGVLLYFGISTLLDFSKKRKRIQSVTNPGFEELTLEPLYYAFSKEAHFDSSLNGAAGVKGASLWKEDVKRRWKTVVLFAASTLVLMLFRLALPKSERMDRFDRFLRHPFQTEIIEDIQDDEVQPLPDPEP